MESAAKSLSDPTTSCCDTCGCRAAVGVDACVSDSIAEFLSDGARLHSLVDSLGSPLNIVFPQRPLENLETFESALAARRVQGRVLCTTKPNKSKAILSSLARAGAAADVSSVGALNHALSCGVEPSRIQATGPKTIEYLSLAIAHGCFITVDSLEEFQALLAVKRQLPHASAARALVRVMGKRSPFHASQQITTTFGCSPGELGELLGSIRQQSGLVSLEGFHFHLHGAVNSERRDTFQVAFGALRQARAMGLSPRIINVGGGYKIRYAKDYQQWARFQAYLKASVRGETKPITWQGSGLGFSLGPNGITGAPHYLDHAPESFGEKEFAELLDMRCPELDDQPVFQVASDALLDLWVEPGRAAFDQAGISVGRITHTQQRSGERPLIRVEMNQSNLRSSQQKLLTQPIFVARGERRPSPQGMFLIGNLCLSQDLLQHNTVYPGFVPEAGDLVVFINTAPYLMDFIESQMLHQPVARKLAAVRGRSGWRTMLDDQYSPVRFDLEEGLA
jgi:diaminopimelate decarboxylase